ncbi:hypothetical protein [Methanolobus sp. ZRKC5]|uniref:hypothetical protein n=1 Tax=unclassified Methanolobus TaxID=2629569 RepID=UPI00313C87D9
MTIAVKNDDGTVDILIGNGAGWNMTAADYFAIRETYENGAILNQCVLRPSSVINYLKESNPRLLEAEIQIEKDKLRRKLQNQAYDFAKLALPFVMMLIGAVVAIKMLDGGGAATIAQQAASVATTTAPITLS